MKRTRASLRAALVALALIAGCSGAFALPPLGRDGTGVVERLDLASKTFQLRRSNDAKPMVLSWNSRTRFIEGREFVSPTRLRVGARVDVIYHSPLFGGDFVTRVVIGTARQSR